MAVSVGSVHSMLAADNAEDLVDPVDEAVQVAPAALAVLVLVREAPVDVVVEADVADFSLVGSAAGETSTVRISTSVTHWVRPCWMRPPIP